MTGSRRPMLDTRDRRGCRKFRGRSRQQIVTWGLSARAVEDDGPCAQTVVWCRHRNPLALRRGGMPPLPNVLVSRLLVQRLLRPLGFTVTVAATRHAGASRMTSRVDRRVLWPATGSPTSMTGWTSGRLHMASGRQAARRSRSRPSRIRSSPHANSSAVLYPDLGSLVAISARYG
jgi:hypothetical protein